MKINPVIFKAYDVRGVYPQEINEEVAYLIGRAYVRFLKKKEAKVVVGQDNRLSSPVLFESLTRGLVDEGANVTDIGFSTSPMLYWSCAFFKFDGGINITASHNSSQYNGFKFVRESAVPISGESGIEEIKELVLKGNFKEAKRGKIMKKSYLKDYINFNLKKTNVKKIKPFEIIVDTANAVSGIVVPGIFEKTKCSIYHIYSELDGSFPNHNPDPHIEENLKGLEKEIIRRKADLGIAFDGDGDRVIFADESGKIIEGDLITALLISLILKENHGEKILCDVRSSKIVRETIEKNGGEVIMWKIGHSFIKEKMRKENIIFEGELNGHYYLRDYYFTEAPLFAVLRILEEMSEKDKKISELVAPFKKYFFSGEINFEVKEKKEALEVLENKYRSKGQMTKIDGLRIDFSDWWFLARPSNTEPILRLVVEANNQELMEQKKEELSSLIKDFTA